MRFLSFSILPDHISFIAFWGVLSLFTGCQKQVETPTLTASETQTDVERIEDVEIIYSDSAVIRIRLNGPVMLNHLNFNDPYQEFTDGIRVEFFNPFGMVTSVLTAKYAVRYQTRGLTYIRDEVVWKSIEGKTLETPELTWDEREKNVYTQKFAVVATSTDTVYSHGFQATQDFKNIKLNAIDGTMNVNEGTPSDSTQSNR